MIKPGVLFWGGTRTDKNTGERVSGWRYGQCYPDDAADMWGGEIGWKDQYHFIHLQMNYDMRGVDRAVDLAQRIVDGRGMVQVGIWGTPKELASIDTDYKENGHVLYPKKPPKDYHAWAFLYVQVIRRFLACIPADKIKFNLWMEPHRYLWRDTDERHNACSGVDEEILYRGR
jgi:hypothetical protein